MRSLPRRRLASTLFVLATAAMAAVPTWAADLRVASSGGFAAAWRALLPAYERLSGNTVTMVWGPSMGATPQAIPQRLKNGEPLDVIIMVDDAAEKLCQSGEAAAATKRVLARSLIAAAVKAGAPRPDISSPEALRQALLAAKTIAYSDSASGVYLSTTLFPKLGVWDQIKDKSRSIPAVPVGEIVARGEAELGFQQLSELKAVAGLDILGLIPEATQQVTLYSAVMVTNSRQADAAQGLIQFLASSAATEAIRHSGLEPTHPGKP